MPNGRFPSHLSVFLDCLPSLFLPSVTSPVILPCLWTSWLSALKPPGVKKICPIRMKIYLFFFFFLSWGALFFPSSHQMSCIHPFHIHPSDDVIDWRSGLESSLWITWSEFWGEPSDSVAGAKTWASAARHLFSPLTLQLTAQPMTQVQM